MLILLITVLVVCLGFQAQKAEKIRKLGVRVNVALVGLSVVLYALWHTLNAWWPAVSSKQHLGMIFICMVGFMSMVLSTVVAFRFLTGIRSRAIAVLSIGIALLHILNLVNSLPES